MELPLRPADVVETLRLFVPEVRLPIIDAARDGLARSLRGLVSGRGAPTIDYLRTPGDPGLFGPDSVTWRVHADFPSMLAGGVSSLMLQALHPLAMAGVYDHSHFRTDPLGRLRRTATYVAGTTYGDTRTVDDLVAMVRRVHETVTGTAPDGRPYAANDPDLLTWVHTAEMASFLKAYVRYVAALTDEEQDRYFAETARLADRMGARNVPRSVAEVRAYFREVRGELVWGRQAREAIGFLLETHASNPAAQPLVTLLFEAAMDLLPSWALRLTGFGRPFAWRLGVVRPGWAALAAPIRWSLRDGAADQARRRAAAGEPAAA